MTGAECAFKICDLASTVFFHNLTVESLDADAIKVPEGCTAISLTANLWPKNLKGRSWALKFQTVTVPSRLPEITCFLTTLIFCIIKKS